MEGPIEKLKQEQEELKARLRIRDKNNPDSKIAKIRAAAKKARKDRKRNRK